VVDDRDVHQSLIKQGLEPQIGTPGEFASFIGRELAKNAQLIRSIAAKPE
jgi:hypothetical protein